MSIYRLQDTFKAVIAENNVKYFIKIKIRKYGLSMIFNSNKLVLLILFLTRMIDYCLKNCTVYLQRTYELFLEFIRWPEKTAGRKLNIIDNKTRSPFFRFMLNYTLNGLVYLSLQGEIVCNS